MVRRRLAGSDVAVRPLGRCQITERRPFDEATGCLEARAVQRAVPRRLGVVPAQHTAEVGAHRPHSARGAVDGRDADSYDLIYNGVEISTGAQREHRIDVLVGQAKEKGLDPEELEFYLDFFRYGVPPHGGFGMGLARVLMLMLEEHSIRETTYLFRGPTRLLP
ncbi:hypothetical protein J7E29_04560 [Streptomyces sp. ISL-90]|nr:hypothetical protein [Streptomyces sp. ISL-90]